MKVLSHIQAGVRRALMALALLALAAFFYLQTAHFQRLVEGRVVGALERATGARVELGGFHFSVAYREAHLRSLTLRSPQAPDLPAFFHAETVLARVRIFSLLESRYELRQLRIERARLEVAFDSQGRSNVPQPPVPADPRRSPVAPIFDLAVGRLEMVNSVVVWNDRREALDFAVESVSCSLGFDAARDRYAGTLVAQGPRASWRGRSIPAWNGRTRFAIERRLLDVTEFSFQTPRSRLLAGGTVRDFRRPSLDLTYQAALDLAEIGGVLGQDTLRTGLVTLQGSLHAEPGSGPFRAVGEARLERASLVALTAVSGSARFEAVRAPVPANAPGRFTVTVTLDPLRLSLLGGEVNGRARVEQLGATPRFTLTAALQGLSVTLLSQALATPDWPLDQLRSTGAVSGSAELSFTGMGQNLELAARVTLPPPEVVPRGFLSLHGRADFRYFARDILQSRRAGACPDCERLVMRDTLLETPASRVTLDGVLGSAAETLRVSLASTNVHEFEPLWRPPIEVTGRAEFEGSGRGPLRAPRWEGTLLVEQWAYQGRRFDRFTGRVAFSPERLTVTNGRIERGAASAAVNASLPLSRGAVSETAALTATVEVHRVEIDSLRDLAQLPQGMRGTLSASLKAGGTLRSPEITGSGELANGVAYEQPFDLLRAEGRYAGRQLALDRLLLSRKDARIEGSLSYHLDQRSYRFDLKGSNLLLADFPLLQRPRLATAGIADFHAAGTGDNQRHSGQADLQVKNLTVNGERVGNLSADLKAADDRLVVQLRSDLLQAKLDARGQVSLREPYPWQGHLEFTGLDLDPLLQPFLSGRITTHSRNNGSFDLSGDLRRRESLEATGQLTDFQISLENVELHNQGPVRVRYHDQTFHVEQAHLVGGPEPAQGAGRPPASASSAGLAQEVDLEASGTIGLAGEAQHPLSLQARGQVNLAVLKTMYPSMQASGQALLVATAAGTWEQPQIRGRLEIRDALAGMGGFPVTLSRLNGVLLFNDTRLTVENLAGESGAGEVKVTGFVDYARRPVSFQLRAQGNSVRVRYPTGVSAMVDTSLNLSGSTRRSLLSGDVTITRAAIGPSFDLAVALEQLKQSGAQPGGDTWAQSLELDLRVASAPDIRFESTRTRNLQAQANLRVRGSLGDPALLGRINILQGQVAFAGNTYNINRGDIAFLNPFRVEPVINLDISTRKQQYDISLDLSGPLDKLSVNYRSDPPLPVSDIQLLLLVGRTPQSTTTTAATNPANTRIGSQVVLSQALNAAVSSRLERFFGTSRMKIDPQVGGPENNPSARLTLEQQVAPDVTLTYITSLTSAQQQIVQLEWSVSRRLSILAVRDQNGFFGIDLRWKKSFR